MPSNITNYQIRKIYAIGGALGIRGADRQDALHDLIAGMTGKVSVKELTYSEACRVIGELEARQGTPPPRKGGRPLRKAVPTCRRPGRILPITATRLGIRITVIRSVPRSRMALQPSRSPLPA